MISRNPLRTAVRLALLPCMAAAGLLPVSAFAQAALEEIVVTARKQEENIQSVPVAITAVSAETIKDLGLRDLADISKITAGLIFDNEFSRAGNRPVIRGQANIMGASGVSYFIDGVYISGSIAAYDLNDVERIEVIKGPQSALYGRNTYSGAINIITKSPGAEFSGDVKVEMAEDDQFEVAGTLRGPLVDGKVAGGITARYYTMGGAFLNTFDNTPIGEQESRSVSGVLQFTPTDDLDIRLRAYYAELEDGQPPLFATDPDENNCYFDTGQLYAGDGRYYCGVIKPHPINSDWRIQAPDATQSNDDLQTSLNIRWKINDSWTLASITGYNDSEETFITEADYGPTAFQTAVFSRFPLVPTPPTPPPWPYGYVGSVIDFTFASNVKADDYSEELRFEFDGDRIDLLFGGYYFHQDRDDRSIRELPPGAQATADASYAARLAEQRAICLATPTCQKVAGGTVPLIFPLFEYGSLIIVPRDINQLEIKNQALFGLVSFDVTDTFSITAEARYQEETIRQHAVSQDLNTLPEDVVVQDSKATFDSFSPRITLDWQFADNHMLYALYAEGTKPGGFNSVTAIEAGLPTYDEEDVESFEVGSKNAFADGQLVLNLALYYNELTGYQLTQNARSGGNTTSATVNAGDAEIKGVELEMSYRPSVVDGLAFMLNYAYSDPTFTKGVDANQGVLNDVADDGRVNCTTGEQFPDAIPPGGDVPNTCQTESVYGSIKGKQIPRTATHQGYFGVELRRPLGIGDGWDYMLGADYSYESSKYDQVHNLAETGDTTLVNARFGIVSEKWSVTLWGRNLTGEDSVPNILRYADGADNLKRNFVGSQRRDTYMGLTVTASF